MLVPQDCHLISPLVADWFARVLRSGLDELAFVDGQPVPSAVWDEVVVIETAVRARRARLANVANTVARKPVTVAEPSASPLPQEMVDPWEAGPSDTGLLVTEAAALVGCSKTAINARCRRGTLPYTVDASGFRRIRREDLMREDRDAA